MPRFNFHSESVETKGGKFHIVIKVTGGLLDTSVVDGLTDVTLQLQLDGTYLLITGGTTEERSARNLHVYSALYQYFCRNNRRPLDELIAEDQAKS